MPLEVGAVSQDGASHIGLPQPITSAATVSTPYNTEATGGGPPGEQWNPKIGLVEA